MTLISGFLDKVCDAVGLDDSPVVQLIKGGLEVGAGALTGDVMTSIEGVKDILDGAAGAAARVEYFASAFGAAAASPMLGLGYAAAVAASSLFGRKGFDQRFGQAVDVLSRNFDLLDTASGLGGRDGLIGKCDLEAALRNPSISREVKDACRFLLANPAAWNRLDVGAGLGEVDGFIGKCDVDAVAARLAASTPAPATGGSGGTPAPGASGAGGQPTGWDARFDNAVQVLASRFDLLDTAAGIGSRDGVIGKCDLEKALENPDLPPEVRDACRFLLANPAAWNQIDVAAGKGQVDGLIGRADVAAMAARLEAQGEPAASGPTGSFGLSLGGGPKLDPFAGMSPEQIVESLMLGMLNDFDGQMVDTAEQLRRAQDSKTNAKQGSSDEKKATEDVNRLTLKLQDLVEKRRQMFEMLSNFSRVNHEMAKTAISNLGRV